MALTFEETNVLGDVVDQTFGKSSTERSGSPQWVVKCRMLNDERMLIDYCTIVNLLSAEEMHSRAKALEDGGMQVIKKYVAGTKEQFKERAGRALKLDVKDHSTSVEHISMSAYNPKKTAYFRVTAVCEYA